VYDLFESCLKVFDVELDLCLFMCGIINFGDDVFFNFYLFMG